MRAFVVSLVMMCMASMVHANTGVLAVINAERSAQGLAPLHYNPRLESAARAHSIDMATHGFMSHTGSDGSTLAKRLRRAGYKYCFGAENVAYGQQSLSSVMSAWMGSSGHRRNILSRNATEVGLARVEGKNGNNWVMVLGSGC